jgi:Ca2+-binding RTX toxin-like protein
MPLTQSEQYLIELINRARLDPQAEADRLGLSDLSRGLSVTITGEAKQALAPNYALRVAARDHSQWMLDTNTFSHIGAGGSSVTQRMTDAGYVLSPPWMAGENISWTGTTGSLNLEAVIESQHNGLFLSDGHRSNILAEGFREIGVAQVAGPFTHTNGITYNASMVTQKFAMSGSDQFLTGVAYQDLDGDLFFGIGEGRSGVEFQIGASAVTSAAAGGYALAHAGTSAQVEVRTAGQSTQVEVDFSHGNVKLDAIVNGAGAGLSLWSSQTITLVSGAITEVGLLGIADIDLTGSARDEILHGNRGNNHISGGGGTDWLYGGDGDDVLNGGDGNDFLRGDDGDDVLIGGFGVDWLRGGAGADVLNGGAGQDWADYITSPAAVNVNLATGVGTGGDAEGDTYILIERVYGSIHNDTIIGDNNVNYLRGWHGDDILIGGGGNDYLQGGTGADVLDGGAGLDWAYYVSSSTGLVIDLANPLNNTGEAAGDTYISIENVWGSQHDDMIYGDAGGNMLRGNGGDDQIFGGDGDDYLRGDAGADQLDGGAGNDWAYYASSNAAVTIDLGNNTAFGGDAEGDTFTSIERVFGTRFNDTIIGDAGPNYLRGWHGNDVLIGGDGNDFLQGDTGADVLDGGAGSDWAYYASATSGQTINLGNSALNVGSDAAGDTYISIENVFGSNHNDNITGDSGANYLRGWGGDDILNGGAGNDILRGDGGADTFHFELGTGTDRVIDFSAVEDFLLFEGYGFANSAAAIAAATQVGAHVEVNAGGDTIIVENTLVTDLNATNVLVA